jgi:hypothetical protein
MPAQTLAQKLRYALEKSYGWKPPASETKNKDFSLALWGLAIFFFACRVVWPVQLLKTAVRTIRFGRQPTDIPAAIVETYVLLVILLWWTVLATWNPSGNGLGLFAINAIEFAAAVTAFEAISSNLYYLLLRPTIDSGTPHNLHRSFVMGALGLVQFWLSMSVVWLISADATLDFIFQGGKDLGTKLTALQSVYFVATTMFTVGYGDLTPNPAKAMAVVLSLCTMIGSFGMVSIIIARAVSLLPSNR